MPQTVQALPAHVGATGIATQHKRVSAAVAATLDALVSGGVPTKAQTLHGLGEIFYPKIVTLQVESGQANKVYYTIDGSTPSATNGFELPVAPYREALPYPDHLKNTGAVSATNQQIQLFAAGATNVQALFEFF
jgi:hypothetical protein